MVMARLEKRSAEGQIRQLLEARLQAIRARDARAAMVASAGDLLLFDLAPPLQYRGADLNRRALEDWFSTFTGPVGYELRDLSVTVGGDVAFGHGLAHITGARTDGTQTDVWVRTTVCLRKLGRWTITHEHVSVPFEMAPPFKAALGLKP
jgi:ketosteroid isomerase-like protein